MELKLERPKGLSVWAKVYCLYLQAFPASERKPFSMILRKYRQGVTDIWSVMHGGRFAGLAITICSPDTVLLDYFAISSKLRGGGIGSAALGLILEQYQDKAFFLEIESTQTDSPEQVLRQRRKNFYLRCGLEELHTTGKLFGVEMELMGKNCTMDIAKYKTFFADHYSQWVADHITE